ncbi:MAG: hypothetical protein V7L02_10235 [Nostoc sp.]|uniref:hypothetical protein n=1 Tax=Nostoc sp. TaxID=1180 RepID=UPI002FF9A3AF
MSVHRTIKALLYLAKSCDRSRYCPNRNCAFGAYCCPTIAISSGRTTRSLLGVFGQKKTTIYLPAWLLI